MHVHHVGFRIKGFYRLAQVGHRWEMDTQRCSTPTRHFAVLCPLRPSRDL